MLLNTEDYFISESLLFSIFLPTTSALEIGRTHIAAVLLMKTLFVTAPAIWSVGIAWRWCAAAPLRRCLWETIVRLKWVFGILSRGRVTRTIFLSGTGFSGSARAIAFAAVRSRRLHTAAVCDDCRFGKGARFILMWFTGIMFFLVASTGHIWTIHVIHTIYVPLPWYGARLLRSFHSQNGCKPIQEPISALQNLKKLFSWSESSLKT